MSRKISLIGRWVLGGSFFGSLFPILTWLTAGSGWSIDSIRSEHINQPALWVVDLAPLILAGAGALVGIQHARVDAALASMDHQIQRRTEELESAYERLERLMASKDQFVAMVSHEVRNPLAVVLGLAEEFRNGAQRFSAAETADLAGLMVDQSMEISNIIDDMLVAARADAGSLTIAAEDVELGEQADLVLKACVCTGEVRDSIAMIAEPVVAWADPARVRQIVRNLVSNAVRYGGPEISVIVRQDGDHASICVCDDGPGIAEADRANIFEPYRQAAGSEHVSGSVGLGLHVSRTLARAMEGDLRYRYESGRSVFDLSLPVSSTDRARELEQLSIA